MQRSKEIKVYADRLNFQIDAWSEVSLRPASIDMWFSQVTYWLQRDVAEAIAKVAPFGIDLCTGIRTNGKLDQAKLDALVEAMSGLRP